MPINKPSEFGEGISNRFRSWVITLCNKIFYMTEYSISESITVNANSTSDNNFTAKGVKSDDVAAAISLDSSLPSGIVLSDIIINTDDQITIRFGNVSGSDRSSTVSGTVLIFKRK